MVKDGDPQPVYDVVLVVEQSANIVPYYDILLNSYVVPTLEHFNNGPADPTDYGHDYSCTLYSVVTYRAGDISPEPASTCIGPSTNIYQVIKFLTELKDRCYGGIGQSCCHVAEGLSTALQVFDGIKQRRPPMVSATRHCILMCNSPPFQNLGAEESLDYRGYNSDQLSSMLGKRGIHFSIISPRKIPILQKMFDAAGMSEGSYTGQKDYIVDPRHMVLLHGYQLQERSHSPTAEDEKQGDAAKGSTLSVPSPAPCDVQFKVPNSIISNPTSMQQQVSVQSMSMGSNAMLGPGGQIQPHQMGGGMHPSQQMPGLGPGGMASQMAPMMQQPQINPRMQAGLSLSPQQHAAVVQHMHQNGLVRGGQVAVQPHMGPGNVSMSNQAMMMGQGQAGMVSQASMMAPQQQQQKMLQQQQMTISTASSMTPQSAGMAMTSVGSMMAGNMTMSQTQFQPPVNQAMLGTRPVGPQTATAGFPGMQGGIVGQSSAMAVNQVVPGTSVDITGEVTPARGTIPQTMRDRKYVWTGALEYHEKSKAVPGQPGALAAQKVTYLLSCRISIALNEPDLSTSNWPEKLTLQLLPQNMLSELQQLCKNSRQVAFHFSNTDQDALRNLHKLMGTGFAGCVHFPPQTASETLIMLLLFSARKRAFIGLIPNDQSAFVQGIKHVLMHYKLKTQPKLVGQGIPAISQAGIVNMGQGLQQNMPQGQGVMDTASLGVGQSSMVTSTTGPAGVAGPVSTQNIINSPSSTPMQMGMQQAAKQRELQLKQQQTTSAVEPKLVTMGRQQQLMAHQQIRQQQQQQQAGMTGHRITMQQIQQQHQQPQANPQQLRQLLQRQQLMLQQQQQQQQQQLQQQHGRAAAPQGQPGVMAPTSQPLMQGMSVGQMTAQPGQSFMDDLNFDMV